MADRIDIPMVLDANGDPVSGALATFFVSGTTTLVTVYSDTGLTTVHPTPLVANASGVFPNAFYSGGEVKVVITDASGASVPQGLIDPVDKVLTGGSSAAQQSFSPSTNNTATNVQDAIDNLSNQTTQDSFTLQPSGVATGFFEDQSRFGINLANSDLVGVNGLFFNDVAGNTGEGIFFKKTSGIGLANWSVLLSDGDGKLQYAPTATATPGEVIHEGIINSPAMLAALKGDLAPSVSDFNAATIPGTYSVADGTANGPTNFGAWDGVLTVERGTGQINQKLVINSNTTLYRVFDGTSWSAWDRAWSDAYNGTGSTRQIISTGVFTQNTFRTVAHTLGVEPSSVKVNAVCLIADQGYEVDDRIYDIGGGLQDAGRGVSVTQNTGNTTSVFLRMGTNFEFRNETTSAAVNPTSFNNWDIEVVVWP